MSLPKVQLLGGFSVETESGRVTVSDFERPLAAQLVKLLALAAGRTLHREQVVDALWPDRMVEQAAPQLHKMATYVRKALGDKESVVFRDDNVMLWPDVDITIDAVEFEEAAATSRHEAVDLYVGDLLPDDLYEEWVGARREHLRGLQLSVLRDLGRWEQVLELEPADEEAHIALMRALMKDGRRLAALRQFERLDAALQEDLGVSPSDEALALRAEIVGDDPVRTELIGREAERFTLRRLLDDARVEAGSLVVLSGPAGIGKSALGEWIADRAHSVGFVVGRSVASSHDDPRPYAAILEAVDDVLRQRPELRSGLPDTHRDELIRVRDAATTEHTQPENGDGHQRLFVAVEALVEAAGEGGIALLIDDLHLADQGSLDLLLYLARGARRRRLLIVATARSHAESGGLEAVRRVIGAAAASEISVGPLDERDARALLTSINPELDSTDDLVEFGGGTPFYLRELARATAVGAHLPTRVSNLARLSLSNVDDDVRDALRRIAVVGTRFDTDQFFALAGVDEDTAFSLLDRAMVSEAIEYTAGGYGFRHGLVRESLLDELAPHQLRRIHREASAQFEANGAPAARVAHHLVEAGELRAAAPHALEAAQAASAVGALADARSMIAPVLDHASDDVRFPLLLADADAMAGMSDPGTLGAYQALLSEAPESMAGIIKAKMAMACLMRGDVEAAQEVLDGVEPDGGPFDGPILQVQGILAYVNRDLDAADEKVAEARQIALSDRSNARLLDVLTLQGMVAHDRGEWFDRMGQELTLTADSHELASTVFDCHL